jgi:hypothetical protein
VNFLGPVASAKDSESLIKNNIKRILVVGEELKMPFPEVSFWSSF